MLHPDLIRHGREFLGAIEAHKYEKSPEGLYFPAAKGLIRGRYTHDVNGEDQRTDHNLLTAEGIAHILAVNLFTTAKISAWYQALFKDNVTPVDTWTAANFVANAGELVSTSQGYTGANRPLFVSAAPSGGKISNNASRASYTIAASSALSVYGAALLSAQARGATSGVLLSAAKFAAVRVLQDTDTFNCGFEVELVNPS